MKAKKNTPVRWSNEEVRLLKKLFPKGKAGEIASQLGRSVNAVRMKAHKLGLRKPNQYPVWSKKELNVLKKLYPRRTAEEIADRIGRPVQAVRKKIFKSGLKRRRH